MSMNVTVGERYEGLIKQLVESGRYESHSEAMRAALRLLEDQEAIREMRLEEMRMAIREGRDSGAPEPWDASDIKALGRKKLAKARGQ